MRVQRVENLLLEKFSGIFAGEDYLTEPDPELNPIVLTPNEAQTLLNQILQKEGNNGHGQRTDEQLGSGNRETASTIGQG